jgi:hypothetical protein
VPAHRRLKDTQGCPSQLRFRRPGQDRRSRRAHAWVANANGDSVTELNASDGSLVQSRAGANSEFYGPWGMADDGRRSQISGTPAGDLSPIENLICARNSTVMCLRRYRSNLLGLAHIEP